MNKRKLSEVNSFNYELLRVYVTIEVPMQTFLAITLGFDFSVIFGAEIGMEDYSIFIHAYAEASLTIFGEVYNKLGGSPVELKAGIGVSLLIANVRVGCKYTYEIMEIKHILEIYIQIKAFELNAYIFLDIEFNY